MSPRTKDTRTQLRVEIAAEIAADYQAIADGAEKPIEEILSERLETTVGYYGSIPGRPLFFDNTERGELEQLVGKNIFSTRDALVLVRNALALKIGSQKIPLKPELLTRLKSRCLGMEWEKFLEQTVVQQLERFVGLR